MKIIRHHSIKKAVLASLSATPVISAILLTALPAIAQQASAGAKEVEEIVVTGSRIARDGYEAPTPVTVINADQFQNTAGGNIADYLNTMPALSNSITQRSTTGTISSAGGGVSGLNLRGLGAQRTLVLLNGQRTVPSLVSGVVDVSEFPQQLISRVDMVTGGASAGYGSDALAGVVNFVLDTEFTGLKAEAAGGMTTYGDNQNWDVELSFGTSFAGGRGHFLLSGEMSHEGGILDNDRDWNTEGWSYVNNPAYTDTNGQPRQILLTQVGVSNATWGGMITSGPLKGTAFGPDGRPYNIVYGTVVFDPNMSGGSWRESYARDRGYSLIPNSSRQNAFTRVSYDLTDTVNVFAQASWAHSSLNTLISTPQYLGNLTVRSDNPFIPAETAARIAALGITSFSFGTLNGDLAIQGGDYDRRVMRYAVGANGDIDAFGSDWAWDVYAALGRSPSTATTTNIQNVTRYRLAIDAVRNATGNIVCRINADAITTNDDVACVPYNLFGEGVNSRGAVGYVVAGQPYQILRIKQNVYAANLSGEPFSTWAGPVSLATGLEHRREQSYGTVSPEQAARTTTWFYAPGIPATGAVKVSEGYVETVIPLAADAPWARALDVNGAARLTHYSTFGTIVTWKAGVTYSPIDDLRFRLTRSHDFRAPTLADLYSAGTQSAFTVFDPARGVTTPVNTQSGGNPGLGPETSMQWGIGAVVQPSFIPGLSASVDYYKIDIENGISSVGAQNVVDACFAGNQNLCRQITRGIVNGVDSILTVSSAPANVATRTAKGIDFEASYAMFLDQFNEDWSGRLQFRGLATHYVSDFARPNIPGLVDSERAGSLGAGIPDWQATLSINYSNGPINATLSRRSISGGLYDTGYIECTSGCPTSTPANITVDNNKIPGTSYLDFNIAYKFMIGETVEPELFLSIRNLTNKDPVIVAPLASYSISTAATNPSIYDVAGREIRAGFRLKM